MKIKEMFSGLAFYRSKPFISKNYNRNYKAYLFSSDKGDEVYYSDKPLKKAKTSPLVFLPSLVCLVIALTCLVTGNSGIREKYLSDTNSCVVMVNDTTKSIDNYNTVRESLKEIKNKTGVCPNLYVTRSSDEEGFEAAAWSYFNEVVRPNEGFLIAINLETKNISWLYTDALPFDFGKTSVEVFENKFFEVYEEGDTIDHAIDRASRTFSECALTKTFYDFICSGIGIVFLISITGFVIFTLNKVPGLLVTVRYPVSFKDLHPLQNAPITKPRIVTCKSCGMNFVSNLNMDNHYCRYCGATYKEEDNELNDYKKYL